MKFYDSNPNKSVLNIKKHSITFNQAWKVFQHPSTKRHFIDFKHTSVIEYRYKAARIRTNGILKTLQDGVAEGRITQAEFDEHQLLASQVVNELEGIADESKLTSLHNRMTEILDKAQRE